MNAAILPSSSSSGRGPAGRAAAWLVRSLLAGVLAGGAFAGEGPATAATSALEPLAYDLLSAVVCDAGPGLGPMAHAITLLCEEVEKRSGRRWPVVRAEDLPEKHAAIVVGPQAEVANLPSIDAATRQRLAAPLAAEGYRIATVGGPGATRIVIAGQEARGVLFGIGHLLRTLRLGQGRAGLVQALDVTAEPRHPIRGIQLGYRAMSNSYSGWGVVQFEQQIRDLAVFGCNIIELVAGSETESAPEFSLPVPQMRIAQSRLADKYGLDVWIVAPVRERDYTQPEAVARTLAEWEALFGSLPRLDGVFVPGGDPGSTPPEQLLPLLEQMAPRLRRLHPRATLWVSPQGFNADRLETFFRYLAQRQPSWLTGVVSAAWTDLSTAEIRRRTPERLAVISSNDIGHVLHCQQPLQDFDTAFAITAGREPIAPRPSDLTRLLRATLPGTQGALAYSDGCTDDVNKILSLGLAWDPGADPVAILREYSRYFVGERLGETVTQGILQLEQNWRGPLATNGQVPTTLAHFQAIERGATPTERRNWRLLALLYRSYHDAYTRLRLLHESRLETDVLATLARADEHGSEAVMRSAERILAAVAERPVGMAERTRIFQLAEALFQTIHLKLSVPLYGATQISRGANLDSVDWPLNNRRWLETQFNLIRRLPSEAERRARLRQLVHWTDPGPGGFYDDPGRAGPQPRVTPVGEDDVRFHCGAHAVKTWVRAADFAQHRLAWLDHVATLGATPLEMIYRDLDPAAEYLLRVVYGDTKLNHRVRLVANDTFEIHPLQRGPVPARPLEFPVPRAATQGGTLGLRWYRDPEVASIKGVCHVSEIWLVRKP